MKTAHEAIAAMKAELVRRMNQLRLACCDKVFSGEERRNMVVAHEELSRLLSTFNTLEAEATPEKLVLKNELTGEVVVEKTVPERMRGADPEIAYACTKLLSAGWTLIAPGFEDVDIVEEYDREYGNDPVFRKLVNRNAGISIARHFRALGKNSK